MAIWELVLTGMGVPPYSIRGATQSFEPISEAAQFRRTVNGTLVDLGETTFQKYASTISADDIDPPAVEGKWPGTILTVSCLFELSYQGSLPLAGNDRPAVVGSAREEAGFVFYRPILTMMVIGFTVEHDQWGKVTSWQMDLEEV